MIPETIEWPGRGRLVREETPEALQGSDYDGYRYVGATYTCSLIRVGVGGDIYWTSQVAIGDTAYHGSGYTAEDAIYSAEASVSKYFSDPTKSYIPDSALSIMAPLGPDDLD